MAQGQPTHGLSGGIISLAGKTLPRWGRRVSDWPSRLLSWEYVLEYSERISPLVIEGEMRRHTEADRTAECYVGRSRDP